MIKLVKFKNSHLCQSSKNFLISNRNIFIQRCASNLVIVDVAEIK